MSTTLTPTALATTSTVKRFHDPMPLDIVQVQKIATRTTVERGRVFYHPGDPADTVFILERGVVALSRVTLDGKKLVMHSLGPGSVFGETAIVGQRIHENHAEALTDCHVLVISCGRVEQLMLTDPQISVRMARALCRRLLDTEARLEEMAFKRVQARLAALLLRLGTDADGCGQLSVAGLTHQHLAELIGTYRETVTVALRHFRARGLVQIGRQRITLLNPDQLAEIADA